MLRWPDRLAIGAENEAFAHGCSSSTFRMRPETQEKKIPFIDITGKWSPFFCTISEEQDISHQLENVAHVLVPSRKLTSLPSNTAP